MATYTHPEIQMPGHTFRETYYKHTHIATHKHTSHVGEICFQSKCEDACEKCWKSWDRSCQSLRREKSEQELLSW